MHITFLENKPNVEGKGPTWLFDLDYLTDSMNYHPVRSENQANHYAGQQEANHHASQQEANHHAGQQEANQNAGTEDINDAGDSETEDKSAQDCFVLPIWPSYSSKITTDFKTDENRDGPREEEQVYVLHQVYKVVKALYGLHQAPKAWYATLSTFLLQNVYRYLRGTINKTLFIKKDKHDIILVQVYVDDIIFGSTKKS
ncbi:copia protein [Tanacetum coccineum]